MPVRKKRQKGYGIPIRKKRQRGYGGARRRIFIYRKNQIGRGEKWEKFKKTVKRGWKWAKPKIVSAGKKALPALEDLVMKTPREQRREALKRIGKQFGKDVLLEVAGSS